MAPHWNRLTGQLVASVARTNAQCFHDFVDDFGGRICADCGEPATGRDRDMEASRLWAEVYDPEEQRIVEALIAGVPM